MEEYGHDILNKLEEVRLLLDTEHAPFVAPVLKYIEATEQVISNGFRDLAQIQQGIYDALQESNQELKSQNESLKLMVNLLIAQNKVLLATLPLSVAPAGRAGSTCHDAETATDRIASSTDYRELTAPAPSPAAAAFVDTSAQPKNRHLDSQFMP